jgi:hypothetical protein
MFFSKKKQIMYLNLQPIKYGREKYGEKKI